jgi:hypothetical protein
MRFSKKGNIMASEKYKYYVQSYLEKDKKIYPANYLERIAFLIFTEEATVKQLEKFNTELSDISDVPNYYRILLDFKKTHPINSQDLLPYTSPHNNLIKEINSIGYNLRDFFRNHNQNFDSYDDEYEHFDNYYKYVFALQMLESFNSKVLKKTLSEKLISTHSIDPKKITAKAKDLCRIYVNTSIKVEINGFINQIIGIYKLNGYQLFAARDKTKYFLKTL